MLGSFGNALKGYTTAGLKESNNFYISSKQFLNNHYLYLGG
jgi:hypothetical protein